MHVQVRQPLGRLTRETIDVPELCRVRVPVQNVIDPQACAPVPGEGVLDVGVQLAIATALYLIVRRQGLVAQISIFGSAAPGTEVFYIDIERAGCKWCIGQISANVSCSVDEVRREASMVPGVARVELQPPPRLIGQIDLEAVAPTRRSRTIFARIRIVGGL